MLHYLLFSITQTLLKIKRCKKAGLKDGEVALIGSIFTHFDIIKTQFEEMLNFTLPNVKIVTPRFSPSQDAAILAKEI